jgi:hypothetical protein
MTEQSPAYPANGSERVTIESIEQELRHGGAAYVTLCNEVKRQPQDASCREELAEQVNNLLLLLDVPLHEWAQHVRGVIRSAPEAPELTRRHAQDVAAYTQLGEWLHELTWRDMKITDSGGGQSDTVTIVMNLPLQRQLLLVGKGECWYGQPSDAIEWRMEFRAAIMEYWLTA